MADTLGNDPRLNTAQPCIKSKCSDPLRSVPILFVSTNLVDGLLYTLALFAIPLSARSVVQPHEGN